MEVYTPYDTHTCCFFGYRVMNETEDLKIRLQKAVEMLIIKEGVDTFLFGSKSRFNDLCREIVTKIKAKYSHIKCVYVRAEYPYISDEYKSFLLKSYDETYYPEKIIDAGKSVYIQRNCEMINKSDFCIIYFDNQYTLNNQKCGTKIALDYAIKKEKSIINVALAHGFSAHQQSAKNFEI